MTSLSRTRGRGAIPPMSNCRSAAARALLEAKGIVGGAQTRLLHMGASSKSAYSAELSADVVRKAAQIGIARKEGVSR
jgi:hypothetical protein